MNLIATCMKNEGPFVLEWVAYHLAIGFDRFLVYTNDCQDGTDAIFDRLAQLGLCTHLPNPAIGNQRPQAAAMRDIVRQEDFHRSEWFLLSDCDEFLNIRLGEGMLSDLVEASAGSRAISVTWRLFGNAGQDHYADRAIIETFLQAAPEYCPHPPQAWGFKTLFRPEGGDDIDRLGAHRPFFRDRAAVADGWLDGGGRAVPDWLIDGGWRFNRHNYSYAWAQMNHYAVRSTDSFLVKSDRGHVLHTHKEIDTSYFRTMNQNSVRETSILRMTGKLRESMTLLLKDGELRDLHDQAVVWHREKAKELRQTHKGMLAELKR